MGFFEVQSNKLYANAVNHMGVGPLLLAVGDSCRRLKHVAVNFDDLILAELLLGKKSHTIW